MFIDYGGHYSLFYSGFSYFLVLYLYFTTNSSALLLVITVSHALKEVAAGHFNFVICCSQSYEDVNCF